MKETLSKLYETIKCILLGYGIPYIIASCAIAFAWYLNILLSA